VSALVRFWLFRLNTRVMEGVGVIEEYDGDEVVRRLRIDREFATWLCAQDAPEGGLVIGEAIIEDELAPVVQGLCFTAISQLAVPGARFDYSYFNCGARAWLTASADGETITLDGQSVPRMSFPARELLPALYACGERFLALLTLLHDFGRANAGAELAYLQKFAAEAREALAARNYG
jgi:hypothetical protein